MPIIDPRIPLGATVPQIDSPLESQEKQLRLQTVKLGLQSKAQELKDQAQLRSILQQTGGDLEKAIPLIGQVNPRLRMEMEKELQGIKADAQSFQMKRLELERDQADYLSQSSDENDYGKRLITLKTAGFDVTSHAQQPWSPELKQSLTEAAMKPETRALRDIQAANEKSQEAVRQAEIENKKTDNERAERAEQRQHELALAQIANIGEDNKRQAARDAETARHDKAMEESSLLRAKNTGAAAQETDPGAIADAIIAGEQPPTLQGLYRMGAPVRSMLAKKGFNLAQAETDWKATQKHILTLNGTQQNRMAQAIDNAAHSLDVIDNLATQWDAGRFPLLNRAALVVAKQGGMGPKAQQIATQLEAQISDVTSELGNVYMGGNSPTDHALGLAAKNLSADWSRDTLKSMTNLARTNLKIRANSMKNVGVAGASAGNPYAAPVAPTTPAAAPSMPTPSTTPAVGSTVTFNGKKYRVKEIRNNQAVLEPIQ